MANVPNMFFAHGGISRKLTDVPVAGLHAPAPRRKVESAYLHMIQYG
jgi:hypothetical protein